MTFLILSLLETATPEALATPVPAAEAPVAPSAREAVVDLECRFRRDGHVADCVILSETPPGQGFGQAALDGARRQTVSPAGRRAHPDGKVRMTTRFRLQD